MSGYYDDGYPLSCGHFPTEAEPEVWWAVLPEITGGTACTGCAATTEECGGMADLIPTNEQMLTELDWEMAGIGTN